MGVEEQVFAEVRGALRELVAQGSLPEPACGVTFKVERPKRPEHGDLATNIALALQKIAGHPPRDLAALVAARLAGSDIVKEAAIAGPGFINLRLKAEAYRRVIAEVLEKAAGYGRAPAATGGRVLVEFVSANPTGPLLISHGRNAVLGDAVASLLEATGHRVVREYYVNDFGNQIRLLGESVRAAHEGRPPPEGGYGGDYVRELASWVAQHVPGAYAGPEALARICVARMLDGIPGSTAVPGIRATLARLGIAIDAWFSEESLYRWGRVDAVLAQLERRGALAERDGALFFRSEDEGDDKDRVVRKSDGAHTYFASDIAYHADKAARGYDRLIVVLGADHHGYAPRVRGSMAALGLDPDRLEVLLFQLVSLLRDGKPYRMGKRLGNLVTITEILDEIDEAASRVGAGADALRYFYLCRRADSPIEIDIELAKRNSLDNPVFYLQMGHARLCSIARRARDVFGLDMPLPSAALLSRIEHPDELAIAGHLGRFPAVVAEAAGAREPHRMIFYLRELAQQFHSYFTRLKVQGDGVLPLASQMADERWQERWDRDKTRGRLLWIAAIRQVYAAGLCLLGIAPVEHMGPLAEKLIEEATEAGNGPPDPGAAPGGAAPERLEET